MNLKFLAQRIKSFFLKFRWRYILLHTFAVCFFMHGVRQFYLLAHIDHLIAFQETMNNQFSDYAEKFPGMKIGELIAIVLFWSHLSMFIGMLSAVLLSFILCKRKKLFWMNSFVVLIISFILVRAPISDSYPVKLITTSVGFWFEKYGLEYVFMINATLLTSLAVFLLFSRWTNRVPIRNKIRGQN